MTIETEVAALTTATTSLLTAVNVSKTTLDAKVADATTQAGTAATQSGIAITQATNAATSAALALTRAETATTQASAATAAAVGASNIVLGVSTLYPAIRPSLDLDFANSQTVDPRITFTRASTATRTNARGLIEAVASGVPRLDFDPVTGVCRGLLIEEQRANLWTYSESINDASWTTANTTVVPNAIVAPDGSVSADSLTVTSNGGRVGKNMTITAGDTVTVTGFCKNISGGFVRLDLNNRPSVWFNVTTGAVTQDNGAGNDATTSYVAGSARITDFGNSWYRCSATVITSGVATIGTWFSPCSASGSGSATGNAAYFWGLSAEVGAFPTSYIPTVASQVTRVADVASMTGANFSSWYRQDEFSMALQIIGRASGTVVYASWNDATTNEVIKVESISGALTLSIIDGGVTQAALSLGTVVTGTVYKIAAAWKLNDIAASINGAAVTTDIAATLPTVTQLGIASSLAFVTGYPKRLTNAELQALSTQ